MSIFHERVGCDDFGIKRSFELSVSDLLCLLVVTSIARFESLDFEELILLEELVLIFDWTERGFGVGYIVSGLELSFLCILFSFVVLVVLLFLLLCKGPLLFISSSVSLPLETSSLLKFGSSLRFL